jgi:hypothetical protein
MEGLAEIITDFFNSIGHKRTKRVRPNDRVCPLYPRKRTSADAAVGMPVLREEYAPPTSQGGPTGRNLGAASF